MSQSFQLSPSEEKLYAALISCNTPVDQEKCSQLMPELEGQDLIQVINLLTTKGMIEVLKVGNKVVFRARDMDEVRKTASMTDDERIIYTHIKGSKNRGLWIKDIKERSGLHAQIVSTAIKSLEKKGLIKAVKSIKSPTKKVYMCSEMEPSVELTGGAWYTDQELDTEFIDTLGIQVFRFIYSKSFPPQNQDIIFPASWDKYPTTASVHAWISHSGITSVELSESDVQSLIDRLVYDGKVIRLPKLSGFGSRSFGGASVGTYEIQDDDFDEFAQTEEVVVGTVGGEEYSTNDGGTGLFMYRAIRQQEQTSDNPYTRVPCGSCPVFSFCSESGPVNPSGCKYFDRWLSQF